MQAVSNASRDSLHSKKANNSIKKSRSYNKENNGKGAAMSPITGPLSNEINENAKEIQAVGAELDKLHDNLNSLKVDRSEDTPIREEVRRVEESKKALSKDKENLIKEIESIRDSIVQEKSDAKKKQPRREKTAAEYEEEIANLERQVESAQFSVKDEKKFLLEISRLRKAKKEIDQKPAVKVFDRVKQLEEDKKAKEEELRKVKEELDQVMTKWKSLETERDAIRKEKDSYKANHQKKDEIRVKIDELKAKRETLKSQRNELFDARKQKLEEQSQIRHINDEIYDLERKIKNTQRQLAQLPDTPMSIEKDAAVTLLKYLRQKAGLESSDNSSNTVEKSLGNLNIRKVDESALSLPKGVKAANLLKKADLTEDDFYSSVSKKKSVKTSAGASKVNPSSSLKLEFWAVAALGKIGVSVPTNFGDIEKTIEVIESKQDEFEGKAAQLVDENLKKATELKKIIEDLEQEKTAKEEELEARKQSLKVDA